jgi:EAL domain-containing protein (putative c-di-GMP-specific phosphodiesterase class I)
VNKATPTPQPTAAELERAIHGNRLKLVYQPKVHLVSNALAGVEALVRWTHERHGPIGPADFIPLAEQSGLIEPLTRWVLSTAASDWVAWDRDGLAIDIAVNISAKNLDQLDFPDRMAEICQSQGMPCTFLTVELTESATQGAIELLDTLTRCRLKGMKISLDDFGTGYSSLIQLQRLPFSDIKIDKSFVIDAPKSRDARVIIRAIIELAHNLGLQATAEGIETEETRRMLLDFGCDMAQGFFFARPMPAGELKDWVNGRGA